MWDGNHLSINMYGEVYNQLSLSVDMHLHEANTFIPISSNFSLYPLKWHGPSGQSNDITIPLWFPPSTMDMSLYL